MHKNLQKTMAQSFKSTCSCSEQNLLYSIMSLIPNPKPWQFGQTLNHVISKNNTFSHYYMIYNIRVQLVNSADNIE